MIRPQRSSDAFISGCRKHSRRTPETISNLGLPGLPHQRMDGVKGLVRASGIPCSTRLELQAIAIGNNTGKPNECWPESSRRRWLARRSISSGPDNLRDLWLRLLPQRGCVRACVEVADERTEGRAQD